VSEIVDPFLKPEDLLKQVVIDFGVLPSEAVGADSSAVRSYHDLIMMVRQFLEGLQSASARAIVIIDDAHQLQPQVLAQLRALANLQTGTGKSPQILLVGQPGLDTLLRHPDVRQLNERVVRRCRLPALTRDEALPYIRHRLAAASDATRAPRSDTLNPRAVDQVTLAAPGGVSIPRRSLMRLMSLSGGVPRTLNLLCDRALEVAFERQTYEISPAVVRESANRVGLRMSLVDRLRARRASLLLAVTLVSILAAGLWTVRGFPRPPGLRGIGSSRAAAIPSSSEPDRLTPPASDRRARHVEPLETADSFAIVVASLKSRERADEAVAALTHLGLPAFVRDNAEWRVVVVGPYVTSGEAGDALTRIPRAEFPGARVQKQAVAQASAR
jgi:general secretion pathway protein A